MAKLYVASNEIERAVEVVKLLQAHGHTITYDWFTAYSEDDQKQKAHDEREGVRNADILVYLWEAKQESARYEAGMAMGLGKPIIAVGHEAFFFLLPEVTCVKNDDDILEALEKLSRLQ
jgi:nucleoside 2-deoxyribosyltransferase